MKIRQLQHLFLGSGLVALCGCSSMMTHTGGQEGYYPGTRASYELLKDGDTSWGIKPFVALDMPFTAVADTLLIPWDAFHTHDSVRARVEKSEQKNLATNSVIPPAAP